MIVIFDGLQLIIPGENEMGAHRRFSILVVILLSMTAFVMLVSGTVAKGRVAQAQPPATPTPESDSTSGPDAFHSSPVMFIENAGQWDDRARFQVWGGAGGTMWLAEDAIWITVLEPETGEQRPEGGDWKPDELPGRVPDATPRKGVNIKISFSGANPHPAIEPFDPLDTTISYFYGNDPDKWRPDVPVWGGVRYVDLWPGVDLVLGEENGRMIPRFEAKEDADVSMVKMQVEGAAGVALEDGWLRMETEVGEVSFAAPRAGFDYVMVASSANEQREMTVRLLNNSGEASLQGKNLSEDNPNGLLFSTYIGGGDEERSSASLEYFPAGRIYTTGSTKSTNFPTRPGYDTSYNGGWDVYVIGLNKLGTELQYATFLGGDNWDFGYSLGLDSMGRIYVAGSTWSNNFPTTSTAYDRYYNGEYDVFVARLDGSLLEYSTYLGGSSTEWATDISVNADSSVSVIGGTNSNNFPTAGNAYDRSYNGGYDGFITKLSATGEQIGYSTFLGGSGDEWGGGIAIGETGYIYATGRTNSSNFPVTNGGYDTSYNYGTCTDSSGNSYPCYDAFVSEITPDGATLSRSTFLGGRRDDIATDLEINGNGSLYSIYVVGGTESSDFPVTANAFSAIYNGGDKDTFVAKLNWDLSHLDFGTFLGGNGFDDAEMIERDAAGRLYIVGTTDSHNFPTTNDAFDRSFNGATDAYLVKMDSAAQSVLYGTFFGGADESEGWGLEIGDGGDVYITGPTMSNNLPTTSGTFDRTYNGNGDVFVAKLAVGGSASTPTPTPTLTPTPSFSSSAIAYTSIGQNDAGIYVMNANGNDKRPVASIATNAGFHNKHQCSTWSPLGDELIFLRITDPVCGVGCGSLYRISADGSNERIITNSVNEYYYPAWSPDGETVAYDFMGFSPIFLLDIDDSNDRSVRPTGDDFHADWSPDGRRLVFYSYASSSSAEIFTINVDGSDLQKLTDNAWFDGYPEYSPDGTKIVFTSDRFGNNDIFVMNADGSNVRRLTTHPASDYEPTWSPDGQQIAFISDRDGNPDVFVMNVDGSNVHNITHTANREENCPTWHGVNWQSPPTPTPIPNQPTPTPALPTPTATPDFPTCHLTIDKTAYPSTARKDGQVGVTLKLSGDCPSEIGSALDVALVIDRSNSMCGDKLNQAQAAGQTFFDNMAFPPDQAAVVSFANTALLHTGLTGNRAQAQNALYNITCGGFSRIDSGLNKAFDEMSGPRRVAGHTPAIILLTDGNPEGAYADDVRAAAQKIKDAGIQLFTIGLGTDVNAALLREIATLPEYYYQSPTADQLQAIYTRLASELRTVPAMNVDITDVIDPNFELVPYSFSGPATPTVHGDTLLWHLPRLESGVTELSFNLKPKSCGTFHTNQSASVSYDDNRGRRQTRTFPNPQVTIEGCNQDAPDAYVRDNDGDTGRTPSYAPWWVSPDIWVRHNNDGGTQHQNPQAGQRNYIYVRIWNRGAQPVRNIDVQMYYANPSLGLSYPDNWTAIGGPVRVDVVQAKGRAIAVIPWDAPNITGHFCLFVRISSPDDPIHDDRTQWENNIAQRNMHIIDYPQPPDGSCQFDENNLLTDRIAFDVVNTQAKSSMVDLQITVSNLGAGAQVRFEPGPLSGRWTSLDGLVQEADGRLRVIRFPATIYGVRLNPHELRTVHLEVKAPANSRFTIGLTELVRGKVVGGNSYQRVLPPCPISLPIILKPAPVTPTPTPLPPCARGGKVDVVFAMDTSGSMNDEFSALCSQINAIVANLQNQGVSVNYRILGLARTFQCASDTVQHLVPGGLVNHEEDWGPAVTDLSNGYAWQPDYARLIIPMSDEGPENGDPVHDPGSDRDAITAAIAAAQAHQVIVSPILGTGHSSAVTRLAQDLANATGGRVFQSTEPAQDIAGAIGDMIGTAACMPVIENVTPSCGVDANTVLTVHGQNFAAGATAKIGPLPARNVVVLSSTVMQMKIDPSLGPGAYDLSITNPPPPEGMTATLPQAITVGPCVTPTPQAFFWKQEAEDAPLEGAMGVSRLDSASNCRYVSSPNKWQDRDAVTFSFSVPRTADYYLWARTMGLSWSEDSFFISIDGQTPYAWYIPHHGQLNTWVWGHAHIQEEPMPPLHLAAGAHTVRFSAREAHSRLDEVILTDDESFIPVGPSRPCH